MLPEQEIALLNKRISMMQETLRKYKELAHAVQSARVLDASIYDESSDQQWLSIDRDDYARMMDILSRLDLWEPWKTLIQRRNQS